MGGTRKGGVTRPSTKEVVETICGYLKQAKENGRPIAILTGAGASFSAGIPLASGFVKQINDDYSHCLSTATKKQKSDYQYCMGQLSQQNRKTLIEEALNKAKINWGHIALAQLVSQGYVSKVLTFNFDLILEKSLSLLGCHVPVYDFGAAPTDKMESIAEPSVIHLHGQGYGIKLVNDQDETDDHIAKLKPVFKSTLAKCDLLIVGYSGDSDPYFKLITEQFDGENNLLWLCHDESPSNDLNGFEQKHNQVRVFTQSSFDLMMVGCAKHLGAWPPEFVTNPLKHIKNEIAEVADYPLPESDEGKRDILAELRQRLADEIPAWEEKGKTHNTIFAALSNPDDDNLFKKFAALAVDAGNNFTDENKDLASWTYVMRGTALSAQAQTKQGKEADKLFAEAGQKYVAALEIKPDKHEALSNWGTALSAQAQTKQGKEADKLFAEAEEKLLSAGDSEFYNLACIYSLTGKPAEAVKTLRRSRKSGNLPSKQHLESDSDLDNLRDRKDFKALLAVV